MVHRTNARLVICLSAVALVGSIVLMSWCTDRPGINWANYCRIRSGMSRAEIEKIPGGPPGGYCTESTRMASDPPLPRAFGADGGVVIIFDKFWEATAQGWLKPLDGTKWSFQRLAWRLQEWWKDVRKPPPRAFEQE